MPWRLGETGTKDLLKVGLRITTLALFHTIYVHKAVDVGLRDAGQFSHHLVGLGVTKCTTHEATIIVGFGRRYDYQALEK
jgi:hypothetical protein